MPRVWAAGVWVRKAKGAVSCEGAASVSAAWFDDVDDRVSRLDCAG